MKNLRPFQIVLVAIFGILAVVAIVFLSAYQVDRQEQERMYGDKVIIWGTLSQEAFRQTLQSIARNDKAFSVVEYREFPESSFDTDLVNAIAEGRSPDLIVLRSDALVSHRAKLYAIPYDTISRREIQDTFIDAAELFALHDGLYGIPFAVDPMVLFWNRDMFSSGGIAQPPSSWEALVSHIVPRLTIRDANRSVLQSAVAFGEYRNVEHAKEVLLLLALQTGSRMVEVDETRYRVFLNTPVVAGSRAPLESAVQFYTDFSNVNSPLYTWNRAMPKDIDAFIAGDLGLYFGLASEISKVEGKNPNLNFDVAMVPQGASATALRTYGDVYSFAIPRATKNAQGAYRVARILAGADASKMLASSAGMASARRDVIAQGDQSLYGKIVLESALIARSWYDPGAQESDSVLMQMIEDIVSNRARIAEAIRDALNRLTLEY
jgi:ABC-type glycerol-3-phosphate transport system substrate-binding protein